MEDIYSHKRILHLPAFESICCWQASSNPHHERVSAESRQWASTFDVLSPCKWAVFTKCMPGLLSSWCYPYASPDRLRLCSDFVSLLFIIDDISDDQNSEGAAATGLTVLHALRDETFNDGTELCRMAQDFRSRFFQSVSPTTYRRFLRNMERYVSSVTVEADLREKDVVLGPTAYDVVRRGNSGCLPAFDMCGIEVPDDVFNSPIFRTMYEDAADLVTLSNDVYSYDREQSSGHYATNIVTVLQRERGLGLQQAVDCAAERFRLFIERSEANMQYLPSFGGEVDAAVNEYIMALRSWVAGIMEWSFESYRYFGERGQIVRRSHVIELSAFCRADSHTS